MKKIELFDFDFNLYLSVLLVTLCQGQNECEGDLNDSATLTACLNYIREVSTDVDQWVSLSHNRTHILRYNLNIKLFPSILHWFLEKGQD